MSTGGGGGGYSGGGGGFSGGFGPSPMSGGGMGGFGGGFGQPFPSYGGGFGMPQQPQYGGGFGGGFGQPQQPQFGGGFGQFQPPQFGGGFGQRGPGNAYAQPFPMSNRFNNQQPVPPPGMKINPTYDSGYAMADDMPPPGSPQALRKQPFIPDPDYTPTGGGYPARDPFGQAFTQVIEPFQSISEPVAATPAMMPQMGGGLMGMLGGGLGGLYGGYQDMPYGGYQPIVPYGGYEQPIDVGIPRMPMAAPFMPTISDETGQYTPPQVMKPAVMPPRVSDETGQFRPPQVILPTPTAPVKPPAAPIKPTTAPSGPPAVQSAISLTKDQLARMGRSSQPRFPMLASRFGPARSSG